MYIQKSVFKLDEVMSDLDFLEQHHGNRISKSPFPSSKNVSMDISISSNAVNKLKNINRTSSKGLDNLKSLLPNWSPGKSMRENVGSCNDQEFVRIENGSNLSEDESFRSIE